MPTCWSIGNWRFLMRVYVAFALANIRYWLVAAPIARAVLARWTERARTIDDPTLRALALEKLRAEGFNAEVAATVVTAGVRAHRKQALEAVVTLTVLYDYLDGLTELPSNDALSSGRSLSRALVEAVDLSCEPAYDYSDDYPRFQDSGYLHDLIGAVRGTLATLPAMSVVADTMRASAARCAEGQVQAHVAQSEGVDQIQSWAMAEGAPTGLEWREFAASAASSVLAVHALIGAATSQNTTDDLAAATDVLYLPVCVFPTLLDSIVDHDDDTHNERRDFTSYYDSADSLVQALRGAADQTIERARRLPNGAHHVMILGGIVAYYSTHPGATSHFAAPVVREICVRLRPLVLPPLIVMRIWRQSKRLRERQQSRQRASDVPASVVDTRRS